jgi:CRP-like cAMP-binding protein
MNFFLSYLKQISTISPACEDSLSEVLFCLPLKKGTILLRNGQCCEHFYLLEKGLARVFYYKDGKDVTAWFADEKMIVSAIDSLFTNQPTEYNIELLEDSIVWGLHYTKLESYFVAYPELERVGRLLITQNYLLLDERMKLFAFCDAEERYQRLYEQMPTIFQRVKLRHIASYLGISQEHLSRIRALKK